jgi:hypothetical protein
MDEYKTIDIKVFEGPLKMEGFPKRTYKSFKTELAAYNSDGKEITFESFAHRKRYSDALAEFIDATRETDSNGRPRWVEDPDGSVIRVLDASKWHEERDKGSVLAKQSVVVRGCDPPEQLQGMFREILGRLGQMKDLVDGSGIVVFLHNAITD